MRKKFIINLIFLVSLNLLIKPFWIFGIDMTVQNTVGASEYGFYFALFNFSLLLNIFLDLGITNFNNRNIAQHNQLLSKHFSNIVGLKFLLGLLYVFLILGGAFFIGYNERQIKFLFILAGNQFLLSLILYMRSNISGLHLFKTDSILSVLDRLLMILIVGYLLLYKREIFKVDWLIYAQSASYIITAIVAFLIVRAKSIGLKLYFNVQFFRAILRKSYPYALLVLLMTSYTRIDSVMLERLLEDGDTQTGIYAHGFRILDAASQYALLFATLLLPMFAKMLVKKENITRLVKISFLLLVIPALIIAINLFFYKNDIVYVLYNEHIKESGKVFGILILGFIPIAVSYIFGTLLTANGNLKELNIMAGIGVILNLLLNFLLIPKMEAYGAALASLITQALTATMQVYIAHKVFGFKPGYKIILSIIAFTAWIILTAYISNEYIISRPIALATTLVIGILSAFTFKLIDLKTLYKIIKYDKT
ncbi:MAG: oligosaccharide flippase family protein [Bacteroidales bacterium]|nr:oligosaccharide flippase family protein [Bacteroidales bacterium]